MICLDELVNESICIHLHVSTLCSLYSNLLSYFLRGKRKVFIFYYESEILECMSCRPKDSAVSAHHDQCWRDFGVQCLVHSVEQEVTSVKLAWACD